MKKYFPILLSKAGEMTALFNLTPNVKDETTPVIQILTDNLLDETGNYVPTFGEKISNMWNFQGNQLLLDVSLVDDITGTITEIDDFFSDLINRGVVIVPVIYFNSPPAYVQLVSNLILTKGCDFCIRENNDSGGFINFNNQIAALLITLNTTESRTMLLLDLGFAENSTKNLLTTVAHQTIQNLPTPTLWKEIIVASGSFLTDLGILPAPATHTSHAVIYRLPRLEWQIWQSLNALPLSTQIKYSDYGTKHPYYVPVAFEGSASIKYTVDTEFVIYRGRKASDHATGGGQYCESAHSLIATADFSGQAFSWGDNEIFIRGNRNANCGNALQWVQMSQNHHITLLHSIL